MKWQHTLQYPLFGKQLGIEAEIFSLQYLKKYSLKHVDNNFHSRMGEIDIIMLDKKVLVFIEVKAGQESSLSRALESIPPNKVSRIKRTATYFLMNNPQYQKHDCRFDVVAITNHGMILDILWLKNAFT